MGDNWQKNDAHVTFNTFPLKLQTEYFSLYAVVVSLYIIFNLYAVVVSLYIIVFLSKIFHTFFFFRVLKLIFSQKVFVAKL